MVLSWQDLKLKKIGRNEEKYVKNILHCSACSPNIYIKQKTFNKTYSDMNCKHFCKKPISLIFHLNKFSRDRFPLLDFYATVCALISSLMEKIKEKKLIHAEFANSFTKRKIALLLKRNYSTHDCSIDP